MYNFRLDCLLLQVLPEKRVMSHKTILVGEYVAQKGGIYTLVFSNAHSKLVASNQCFYRMAGNVWGWVLSYFHKMFRNRELIPGIFQVVWLLILQSGNRKRWSVKTGFCLTHESWIPWTFLAIYGSSSAYDYVTLLTSIIVCLYRYSGRLLSYKVWKKCQT